MNESDGNILYKSAHEKGPVFIAHALELKDGSFLIHNLEDHLEEVAKRAAGFAKDFNSDDWAYVAGIWHDLGKYAKEFHVGG